MDNERIIIELLNRVLILEDKVDKLTKIISQEKLLPEFTTPGPNTNSMLSNNVDQKDTTKYLFNGSPYGKGRLVLAVVKEYMLQHPDLNAIELTSSSFAPRIQGALGVVRTLNFAKDYCSDYEKRFFTKENEIIHTSTEDCVVCSQWGKFNINNFIRRAEELGFNITAI